MFGTAVAGIGIADKFGVTSLIPNFDSGFNASLSDDHRELLTTLDIGDTDCWLQLAFRGPDKPPSLDVRLGEHHRLQSQPLQSEGRWVVIISSAPAGQDPTPFKWPSGWKLTARATGGTVPSLDTWKLHTASSGTDSSENEKARNVAQTVWVAFLVILAMIAGLGTTLEGREPKTWQDNVLWVIIRATEGSDKRETKLMHQLLEKIAINGATLDEAISALSLTRREQRLVPKRAIEGFKNRLSLVQKTIERFPSTAR